MNSEQEALRTYLDEALSDPKHAKALYRLLLDDRSHIRKTGWIDSFVNGNSLWQGELVPWFNYGFVRFLGGRVAKEMRVFEYGAGFSTLWWQRRVSSISAVEHDEQWAARVSELVSPPTTVMHLPLDTDGRYCRAVLETEGLFDVVVVDGRDRVNCMIQAESRLKPDGVFVFDNSQRAHYREGIENLKTRGFREIQFSGIAPMTQAESFTSVLYRSANCFGI